jgi:4'-phosphopantetheinyl transferase
MAADVVAGAAHRFGTPAPSRAGAPPLPALADDEVHVWSVWLDQPEARVRQLARTLTADERRRTKRLLFERDRRRFVVGRGLLRVILGRYLDLAPGRLRFRYGACGKPSLEASRGGELRFSLSHAEGLALYAVARGREVGIDLERLDRLDGEGAWRIARSHLSPSERAALRAVPEHRQVEAFFNCWTRKEAYLKARGDGLSRPLEQVEVSLAPGEPARLEAVGWDAREAERWSLVSFAPAPGYVGALASRGRGWRSTLRCWPDRPSALRLAPTVP